MLVSDDDADGDIHSRKLENPLAAVQMGLIYVNPEGPDGNPDPDRGGPRYSRHLRPHGDERRGNRRADRRRPYLRQDPRRRACVACGARAGSSGLEEQGFGWKNSFGTGKGADTITSGLEVTWTNTPDEVEQQLLREPVRLRMGTDEEPGRRAAVGGRRRRWRGRCRMRTIRRSDTRPTMLTTDLALRLDPAYEKISRRFLENPDQFADAFARAWFKLTHRDMGPRARYLGPEVPAEELIWQDPIPAVDHKLIDAQDIASLKSKILASGLSVSELVSTAWASASTFRGSDKRGGANGARIRLAPQKDWEVNQPAQLAKVLKTLEGIQSEFNRRSLAARRSRWPT